MNKIIMTAACALMLSTTFAAAQSSQGKGGAAVTGETADPSKGMAVPGQTTTGMSREGATVRGSNNPGTAAAPNAPVPNAAISKPAADEAAPAGR